MPPPSAIQGGGSVQQGLSAAYEFIAFCKHRRAADKRYSLELMKQSPLLEFKSEAFTIAPGEDETTNPGIFGKSLAEWLAGELRGRGLAAGEVIAEDFGWCVPVESKPHALYVACVSVEDQPGAWRVFTFAEGGLIGRVFGRDTRNEDVARAYAAVKAAIVARTDVREVSEERA